MNHVLFQFLPGMTGADPLGWVLSIGTLIVFFVLYPRLMLMQIMGKLEKTAIELEELSRKAKMFITKEISPNPSKETQEAVSRFFEFFMVTPVDLDPAGIVKKFDHLLIQQRDRFHYLVEQLAPKKSSEEQANLEMGFAGGIAVHEIAKVVRHFVELTRKTKSYQFAYILSMQIPLIERMAKSFYKGTQALAKGEPVGDGVGPLVAATLTGTNRITHVMDDIMLSRVKLKGRNLLVMKARGPGGRIGNPGHAVQKVMKVQKVHRIVTVDAAAKLEGEKTGSVAEGIGIAMGGIGVERSFIEDVVVVKKIPFDSIVVKMSSEEAITPMKKEIKDAVPKVMESLDRLLKQTKPNETILLFGVGNTSGIGDQGKDAKAAEKWVDEHHQKEQAKKKKRRNEA
ncbi:MAG: DUF1512 domain-containing protein [Nanoarchaeota archaeon]|nr:DUF1512 domain-containing protein [Nanoarchaeota archaeon]